MRPLRNTDPSKINLVTIRTFQAQLLLTPGKELNEMVGGVIAKYQEEFNIEIYAYNILGNHMHIITRAPRKNLWQFCQAVDREIAKRTNRLRGREGTFWGRRYDDQIAVLVDDELEALLYVTCNAVHHGLVAHPELWPGVSSYLQLLDAKDREYQFTNYTAYRKAKLKASRSVKAPSLSDFCSTHTLKLSILPIFRGLELAERTKILVPLIEQFLAQIHKERGNKFLGRRNVRKQSPYAYPHTVKRSPRPPCYTKSFEAKKEFLKTHIPWCAWYKQASRKLRSGDWTVEFPPHCIKPPLHYVLSAA